MPRIHTVKIVAAVCLTAFGAGLGGCAGQLSGLTEAQETGWFSKPMDLFRKPEWARASSASADLGPSGPVKPEDLVSADGQCAASASDAVAAAPAPTPVSAPAGTGFDGGLQTGGAGAGAAPAVVGGIALGMTECQTVRRAGTPSHVAISAGEGGARHVVVTYTSGPWPGIYTFDSGRLKVVDEAPGQEKKPEPKKKPAKKTKTKTAAKQQ
jgi:hypothetical protein